MTAKIGTEFIITKLSFCCVVHYFFGKKTQLVFIAANSGSKCIMQIREVFEISDCADGL